MPVKCEQLIFKPVNALTFRITGGTITPHLVDNVIQSLETSDGTIFSLGQIIKVKELKYKINIITKKKIKKILCYEISMAKRTKASTFIMPMLGGNRRLFFWTRLFLNCFIRTKQNRWCIALLYRWSEDPLFLKFEKALMQFKDFKKMYDPTNNTVLFIFKIPLIHKKDFIRFVKGKYSKLSEQYKLDILRFHNQGVEDEIGEILYKSPERKQILEEQLGVELEDETELLSIANIKEETLNIENYV